MNEYRIDLELAVRTAEKAGNLITQMSYDFTNVIIDDKDTHDFVTNVDKASEELIINELKKYRPYYDIIAEESGADVKGNRPRWIIDPLDGTTNFTKQIPIYAVSIGLEVEGEIVAGVVNNVYMDEMFTAVKGEGAYLNKRRIKVSNTKNIDHTIIGTGFPFRKGSDYKNYISLFEELAKTTAGIRRPGSAAVDLCWFACGRYDAFFEFGLHPWDVAAGTLIASESGAIVTDTKGGDDFIYGGSVLCANNKTVYDFMMNKLKNYYYK
jgi:myo-inositol-1(or 4)-monophosphatase